MSYSRHNRWFPLLSAIMILALVFVPLSTGAASADSLTTIFASDNGYAGNMFDVTVLSDTDVIINSFDINIVKNGSSLNGLVSVYYRLGGYEGYRTDSSAWTLAGSATVVPMGVDNPTPLPIGGIQLTAGETYGFYVTVSDNQTSASI
jgi:hypothetical protein